MNPKSSNRSGKIVLWFSVTCVCAAILTTLLLANDKRNLRYLFARYNLDWPFEEQQAAAPEHQRDRKRKRLIEITRTLPERFFKPDSPAAMGIFLRNLRVSGPLLCERFARAGALNEGWKQSLFDRNTFECISERKDGPEAEPDKQSSLFLVAKGTPEGIVNHVRLKLILRGPPGEETIRTSFFNALRALFEGLQWGDIDDAIAKIAKLEKLQETRSGIKVEFFREFTDANRFNFILSLVNSAPDDRRTRAYFDSSRWLGRPERPLSNPAFFVFDPSVTAPAAMSNGKIEDDRIVQGSDRKS